MEVAAITTWDHGRIYAGTLLSRSVIAVAACCLIAYGQSVTAQSVSTESATAIVHVDVTPGHAINSFDPDSALGSSIDVLSHDGIDKVYTPHIIQ
jgi:hypothetical protein